MNPLLIALRRYLGHSLPLLLVRLLGWLALALLALLVLWSQRRSEEHAARMDRAVFRAELRDSVQRVAELQNRAARHRTDSLLTRQDAEQRALSESYRRRDEKHARHYRAARVPLPDL